MTTWGSPSLFAVHAHHGRDTAQLRLAGELDLAAGPVLEQAFDAVEARHPTSVIVDLSDVSFVDGIGLLALLKANCRAAQNGWILAVVNVGRGARKVFEITGTEWLIDPVITLFPLPASWDQEEGPALIPMEVADGG